MMPTETSTSDKPEPVSRAGGGAPFDCSVVIPLYNKGPFVERTLRSILKQTHQPREIVVMDDGSTDDGFARALALAEKHPVIRCMRNPEKGVSQCRNNAIAATTGQWVAFIDADDAWTPWYLAEMAQLSVAHPEATFMGASWREASPDFDLDAEVAQADTQPVVRGAVENFYDRWWRGNVTITSSTCVRRTALDAFPHPFPLNEWGEDMELFFSLAEHGKLIITSRIGTIYALGVPQSYTPRLELDVPPCFVRLKERIGSGELPEQERTGARRLVATKILGVARDRIRNGDAAGACKLLADPVTIYRPTYWLRTAMRLPLALALAKYSLATRSSAHPTKKDAA